MADIALTTAGRVSLVEAIGHGRQRTLVASVAITAGAPMYIDANGKWALSDGNGAGIIASVYAVAAKTVIAGEALTGIRLGTLDGFDLTALAYGAPVYLSDTIGRLGETAGTTPIIVGQVVPGNAVSLGTVPDKLLEVEPRLVDLLV